MAGLLVLYLVSASFLLVTGKQRETIDDYLSTCFDARFHKDRPGPEPELHGECKPWTSRACCNFNTTQALHTLEKWLNFNWNHCPGHNLSAKCGKHFRRDLCFYECSPNTGPWIKPDNKKIRNERFVMMPLCESECSAWWEDCKNEYTCRGNWGKGFNWTTGSNTCPTGSICKPFTEIFVNSTTFCKDIWDGSWEVVADSQPCMKLSFNGTNPNDAVAKWRAEQLVGGSGTVTCPRGILFLLTAVIIKVIL